MAEKELSSYSKLLDQYAESKYRLVLSSEDMNPTVRQVAKRKDAARRLFVGASDEQGPYALVM